MVVCKAQVTTASSMAPRRHDRGLVKAKKEAMAAARSNVNTIRIRSFEVPRGHSERPHSRTSCSTSSARRLQGTKLNNPWLPSDMTAIQLQNLYRQVLARFKQVQTFSYPGNSMEDSSVPVTTPSHEKITYHIITLRDVRPKVGRDHCEPAEGRKYDGPAVTVQLLKEESDNYITAWSVLRNGGNARWFAFHDNVTDLDPQIFGDVTVVKYSGGYTNLHDVNISRHTLPRAIDFLVDFDPDVPTTNIGIIIFHSLFVMFGEGQRLASLQRYVFEKVPLDCQEMTLSDFLVKLICTWDGLSFDILCLLFDLLQSKLAARTKETRPGCTDPSSCLYDTYQPLFLEIDELRKDAQRHIRANYNKLGHMVNFSPEFKEPGGDVVLAFFL